MAYEQINYNVHVIQLNNEFETRRELSNIKSDKSIEDLLVDKMTFLHVKLEQVDTRAANLLKKNINAIGGEAILSKGADFYTERTTDIILSASKETLRMLTNKIANLPYNLDNISKEIYKHLFQNYGVIETSNKNILDFRHKTYIMGILKFYRIFHHPECCLDFMIEKAESMVKAGVNIIDICEADLIKSGNKENEEKINKLIPLIKTIKKNHPEVILSINTSDCLIAKETLNEGIDLLIEGIPLKYNEKMAQLIANKKCPVVLMHSNSLLHNAPKPLNSISDIIREIQSNISYATGQGIEKEKIIIEPGIGFGRRMQDNFLILRQLSSFRYLNVPILVSLPKHSFLGEALRGRMRKTHISSIAANTMAIINGANIIRVHEVEQAVAMVNIVDAIRTAN